MQTNATTNANKCEQMRTNATTNANKCHNKCKQMQTNANKCKQMQTNATTNANKCHDKCKQMQSFASENVSNICKIKCCNICISYLLGSRPLYIDRVVLWDKVNLSQSSRCFPCLSVHFAPWQDASKVQWVLCDFLDLLPWPWCDALRCYCRYAWIC